MGASVEFLIDVSGRARRVGNRGAALAVSKGGQIHFFSIQRPASDQNSIDRTDIVTLQPRLVSGLSLAALGYKLADFNPQRTVVVLDQPAPKCWVFGCPITALRAIAALMSDPKVSVDPPPNEVCCRAT
jgi:hypothetical protein